MGCCDCRPPNQYLVAPCTTCVPAEGVSLCCMLATRSGYPDLFLTGRYTPGAVYGTYSYDCFVGFPTALPRHSNLCGGIGRALGCGMGAGLSWQIRDDCSAIDIWLSTNEYGVETGRWTAVVAEDWYLTPLTLGPYTITPCGEAWNPPYAERTVCCADMSVLGSNTPTRCLTAFPPGDPRHYEFRAHAGPYTCPTADAIEEVGCGDTVWCGRLPMCPASASSCQNGYDLVWQVNADLSELCMELWTGSSGSYGGGTYDPPVKIAEDCFDFEDWPDAVQTLTGITGTEGEGRTFELTFSCVTPPEPPPPPPPPPPTECDPGCWPECLRCPDWTPLYLDIIEDPNCCLHGTWELFYDTDNAWYTTIPNTIGGPSGTCGTMQIRISCDPGTGIINMALVLIDVTGATSASNTPITFTCDAEDNISYSFDITSSILFPWCGTGFFEGATCVIYTTR